METLTDKQKNIYNIIKKFINENNYSPSVREIAKLANLNSTGTVYEYMTILSKKGYIEYEPKIARTIRIKGE